LLALFWNRSWHHQSFDGEADVPGVPPVSAWTIADYGACKWPRSVPGGWALDNPEGAL
jgi:hypothetical protein